MEEPAKFYHKLAEQGNSEAQHNLGFSYAWGLGVGKDDNEAKQWVFNALESARKHNMKAVELLALELISKKRWFAEETKQSL